jgi:hypothetical protein
MISLRTILLGTLTRFLPALILGTALLYGMARLADQVSVGWTGLGIAYAMAVVGYAGALIALRYRLRADASVAGRRSVVAGLLVPAAYLSGIVLLRPTSTPGLYATGLVVGALLAVGMFFPWLKGTPVAALTDQEAQSLLEESHDLAGLDRSHEAVFTERRPVNRP